MKTALFCGLVLAVVGLYALRIWWFLRKGETLRKRPLRGRRGRMRHLRLEARSG
jgi:hypothetical protein